MKSALVRSDINNVSFPDTVTWHLGRLPHQHFSEVWVSWAATLTSAELSPGPQGKCGSIHFVPYGDTEGSRSFPKRAGCVAQCKAGHGQEPGLTPSTGRVGC